MEFTISSLAVFIFYLRSLNTPNPARAHSPHPLYEKCTVRRTQQALNLRRRLTNVSTTRLLVHAAMSKSASAQHNVRERLPHHYITNHESLLLTNKI